MHAAAGAGAVESIELLLSAGLSPKARDQHGRTPLHLAAAQGSAQCVAFLCIVARSTVVSRDKVTGDTPLHSAVRSRHGVCIEVILLHAQGPVNIMREPNAKGETPLDVAATLDDDNAFLWALEDGDRRWRERSSDRDGATLSLGSGDHVGGQELARRKDGIDFERIMAVWEKFFENAAVAYGWWDGDRPKGSAVIVEDEIGRHRGVRSTRRREDSGWWDMNDQPRTSRMREKQSDVQPATSGRGSRKDVVLKEGGAGDGRIHSCRNNPQHVQASPTTPRFCAWTSRPLDLVHDRESDDRDAAHTRQHVPQQPKEHLRVRLGSEQHEASTLSPHDADLHLFHTPREDSDGETSWGLEPNQAKVFSSLEPPILEREAIADPLDTAIDVSSPYICQEAWVACWDASSESIYYWNSESGEATWDGQSCATSCGEEAQQGFPNRVWDPQQEAFFAVDERGVSHWLMKSTCPTASVEGQEEGNGAAGTSITPFNGRDSGGEKNDDFRSFYDSKEQDCRHDHACSPQARAEKAYLFESTDAACGGHGAAIFSSEQPPKQPSCTEATAPTFVANKKNTGRGASPNSDDFFDTEECRRDESLAVVEGGTLLDDGLDSTQTNPAFYQLSAWVMWCAISRDEDAPPYFVNEETCSSSWVLPPKAVVASGGWLRAWSEEHQAPFFANQWTGRVTWHL
ncbi:unnamed protein product, partial [Hapterophycus canaliculatus]